MPGGQEPRISKEERHQDHNVYDHIWFIALQETPSLHLHAYDHALGLCSLSNLGL
jgi:hypothetical protein